MFQIFEKHRGSVCFSKIAAMKAFNLSKNEQLPMSFSRFLDTDTEQQHSGTPLFVGHLSMATCDNSNSINNEVVIMLRVFHFTFI